MAFGVYFHIPYCLQRCTYCDFATYVHSEILPPEEYVKLVLSEMEQHRDLFPAQELTTIYFGGGTPSLVDPALIKNLVNKLESLGFSRASNIEMTIEINPATLTPDRLAEYQDFGFNRFSVGAQTFNDLLLKSVNRQHTAADTRDTLDLLGKKNVNYNFDILFSLPGQTLKDLEKDLSLVREYLPPHISPYCLTVPEGHPLSRGRPPEDEQVEMFHLIDQNMTEMGYNRYEISNYAIPGKESRHNLLYWQDEEYWGIGLSAHSYRKSGHGYRFWNPSNMKEYERFIYDGAKLTKSLGEQLAMHQSLTDFCHTSLRIRQGLSEEKIVAKFPSNILQTLRPRLNALFKRGLLRHDNQHWSLTPQGILLSNLVFQELTFLPEDIKAN